MKNLLIKTIAEQSLKGFPILEGYDTRIDAILTIDVEIRKSLELMECVESAEIQNKKTYYINTLGDKVRQVFVTFTTGVSYTYYMEVTLKKDASNNTYGLKDIKLSKFEHSEDDGITLGMITEEHNKWIVEKEAKENDPIIQGFEKRQSEAVERMEMILKAIKSGKNVPEELWMGLGGVVKRYNQIQVAVDEKYSKIEKVEEVEAEIE